MKCANCGGVIEESNSVCPNCGEQLNSMNTFPEKSAYDDMTYLGDVPSQNEGIRLEEKTVFDSNEYRFNTDSINQDVFTQTDSSVFQMDANSYSVESRNLIIEDRQERSDRSYGLPEDSSLHQQQHSDSLKNGWFYTSNDVNSIPVNNKQENIHTIIKEEKRSLKPIIIVLMIVVIAIVLIAAYFLFIANRKPTVESMTYQDLVLDYALTGDESDAVKNAFHDRARIEFEDFQNDNSGYKAKAYVYTPDMDTIYGKTVDENEIIDIIQKTADSDLNDQAQEVQWNQSGKELTKSSAKTLQRMIDDQYVSVTTYLEKTDKTHSSETSSIDNTIKDSGNSLTINNNQNNSNTSVSSNSGNQKNTDDTPTNTDGDTIEDESHLPFYGVWCTGYKTEAEALSYIQSSGLGAYNPQIFITTQWSNLNKEKFFVVTAGVYKTKSAADNALSSVKSIVPDAYVKYSGNWIG